MKTILFVGAILAVMTGVSACGQRGPLVLPAPEATKQAPTTQEPARR